MKNLNINQIAEYYFINKYSLTKIANVIGKVSWSTIGNRLRKYGYVLDNKSHDGNGRRHAVDINYFKEINNNNKAYILGLIVSDGYVDEKIGKLTFTSKDFEMVKFFKEELKSEHKLGKYEILDKRTNKISIRYSIQISSNKMIQDLIDLNVRQKKSFTSEYPKIDEKYFWSFFRGLFDGDGCITKDKNKYVFSIIAAEKLMIMIQKQMSLLKIINTKLSVVATKNNTIIYRYKKSKKSDLIKIYNKMYENNDFSLERKYKLFSEILN
jgi:hypothetical protein